MTTPLHAAWEPLQPFLDGVESPTAKITAVLLILAAGLLLAFAVPAGRSKRLIVIVLGAAIAVTASSFLLTFAALAGAGLAPALPF